MCKYYDTLPEINLSYSYVYRISDTVSNEENERATGLYS